MKGMFNKVLNVNLTSGLTSEVVLDDLVLEKYIGGRGLGAKLFVDRVPVKADPLGPENCLVFTTGPVTGSQVPTSGRFACVTKSPLTGSLFYCNTGGSIGVHLKRCGTDGLIIEGVSEKPVYIVIDGETGVSVKDASGLWGLDTEQTYEKLKADEGAKSHVLMIGPAGENQVLISAIMNDAGRAFGRGGVGAVMGSKKLKAVVVKNGNKKAEIHDDEHLKLFVKQAFDKIKVAPVTRAALPLFGTSALVNVINDLGMLPVRNFQEGYDKESSKVSGESIRENIFQKQEGCYNCPINCGRMTKVGAMEGKGPEYETVWALGPNCGVFDLDKVTIANYWCNKLGIDTISAGATISCAMELQQKGLIDQPEIRFGNADILTPLVKMIASKEGIGAEMSEGSKRFSRRYHSEDSSMQVKGLELPAYDPRGAMGHALGYATSNRGGCHLTGYMAAMEIFAAPKKIDRFSLGSKPDLLALKQNQAAMEDSLSVCKFVGYALGFDFQARFVSAITGVDLNIKRLVETGERVYNLERMYNVASGMARRDDSLPKRFLDTPLKEGLSKDHVVPLEQMLDSYYDVRQWSRDGIPTRKAVERLGLDDIRLK